MSSDSETDEEYVPGEPEQLSEEESADEETDKQYETELERKAAKRKQKSKGKGKKRRKTKEPTPEKEPEPEKPVNPEEEKKRADDLWAQFLDGTDTKPIKPVAENGTINTTVTETKKKVEVVKLENTNKDDKSKKDDMASRETRIFEFAGEAIVVENNVIKEKVKIGESSAAIAPKVEVPSRGRGGLSSLVGQLNKKNKLSTLEKTKLDWNTFKTVEGVAEEVESHNKGKHGYLDRQEFLERADLRQFELEREVRLARRSNR